MNNTAILVGKTICVVVGIQGLPGQNLQIHFTGDYDATADYIRDEAVSYEGNAYINILACSGVLPTDETYWSILVSGGFGDFDGGDF